MKFSRFPILFMFLLSTFMVTAPKKVQACCSCSASVIPVETTEWTQNPNGTIPLITNHVTAEFNAHRIWLISVLWEDNILPAMMMMAEQLTAVAMQQVGIIGTFLDAKNQMETQQVLQKLQARAHKDYQPSVGMCEFGTSAKSLAASERKAEFNAVLLSQRSQDRVLGNANTSAATGEDSDKPSRLKQFREKFCDPQDNNNGLGFLCDHDQDQNPATGQIGAVNKSRMNKDIDYARTLEAPWTLDMDFTDSNLTDNEEEVMALAANLYGHNILKRPPSASLQPDADGNLNTMQKLYMDSRALVAKSSVAENSFNAIAAMKSSGMPGSKEFMRAILEEVGVSAGGPAGGGPSDIDLLLGENPSYYAQMEVLTKKIFQNPDFYTNLYDKPANVDRKGVALQAIGLMQKFDLFKSYLRNEASLSVLLELAVTDLQNEVENDLGEMTLRGEPATK